VKILSCCPQSQRFRLIKCLIFAVFVLAGSQRCFAAEPSPVELVINTTPSQGSIDLTRYALGDGTGVDRWIPQLQLLHPQTIRFFVMNEYDLYPAHNQYRWDKLDAVLKGIHATGAKPILCLCIKPRILFPKLDQKVVFPNSWEEWETLLEHLVKHCNERHLEVGFWEVNNEPDLGESGGSPYLFTPQSYLTYYAHTVKAIRRADPNAKVGGPALAFGPQRGKETPILDALLKYCAEGNAPLDFISWHLYDNNPKLFREEVAEARTMLAKYESLRRVETILDEWNMDLFDPISVNPYYQPAFIMENVHGFYEEGLSRSAYYHITDFYFDPKTAPYLSPEGAASNDHLFNVMPLYLGLFDTEGRVRPAYFAFKILSLIRGEKLAMEGAGPEVKGFAARDHDWIRVVFWNFPEGEGKDYDVSVRFPQQSTGGFQLIRLDPESAVNNLKIVRSGNLKSSEQAPLRVVARPYEIYWVELSQK